MHSGAATYNCDAEFFVPQAIEFEKPPHLFTVHLFIDGKATVQVILYGGKVLLLNGLLDVGNILCDLCFIIPFIAGSEEK